MVQTNVRFKLIPEKVEIKYRGCGILKDLKLLNSDVRSDENMIQSQVRQQHIIVQECACFNIWIWATVFTVVLIEHRSTHGNVNSLTLCDHQSFAQNDKMGRALG
jgi:hypothetical protein